MTSIITQSITAEIDRQHNKRKRHLRDANRAWCRWFGYADQVADGGQELWGRYLYHMEQARLAREEITTLRAQLPAMEGVVTNG